MTRTYGLENEKGSLTKKNLSQKRNFKAKILSRCNANKSSTLHEIYLAVAIKREEKNRLWGRA